MKFDQHFKIYTYKNEDNYIKIEFYLTNISQHLLDIERYKSNNAIINGLTAYILSTDKDDIQTSIVWGNKSFTLILDAPVNSDQAIKIAESIKVIKK